MYHVDMETQLERYVADILDMTVSELDPRLLEIVASIDTMVEKLGGRCHSRQVAAIAVTMWRELKKQND